MRSPHTAGQQGEYLPGVHREYAGQPGPVLRGPSRCTASRFIRAPGIITEDSGVGKILRPDKTIAPSRGECICSPVCPGPAPSADGIVVAPAAFPGEHRRVAECSKERRVIPDVSKRRSPYIPCAHRQVRAGGHIAVCINAAVADPRDAAPAPCRTHDPGLVCNAAELRGTGRADIYPMVPVPDKDLADHLFVFQNAGIFPCACPPGRYRKEDLELPDPKDRARLNYSFNNAEIRAHDRHIDLDADPLVAAVPDGPDRLLPDPTHPPETVVHGRVG